MFEVKYTFSKLIFEEEYVSIPIGIIDLVFFFDRKLEKYIKVRIGPPKLWKKEKVVEKNSNYKYLK